MHPFSAVKMHLSLLFGLKVLRPLSAPSLSVLSSPLCPHIRSFRHRLMPHSSPSSLHWTTSLRAATSSHPILFLSVLPHPQLDFTPPPCPSSLPTSLSSPRFTSSSQDPRGVGCAELATSDSCDAPLGGHRQSRLVFSPPVSSVFCLFISPAHRALNVFRCPAFFFCERWMRV